MFNLPASMASNTSTSGQDSGAGAAAAAYVTLQKIDSRGFNPVDHEDLSSGGSLTPVVTPTSPTSLASAASIHGMSNSFGIF